MILSHQETSLQAFQKNTCEILADLRRTASRSATPFLGPHTLEEVRNRVYLPAAQSRDSFFDSQIDHLMAIGVIRRAFRMQNGKRIRGIEVCQIRNEQTGDLTSADKRFLRACKVAW
jgi:hypothetical protein